MPHTDLSASLLRAEHELLHLIIKDFDCDAIIFRRGQSGVHCQYLKLIIDIVLFEEGLELLNVGDTDAANLRCEPSSGRGVVLGRLAPTIN